MLDTTFRAATPEGIELDIRIAGPVPRALAWLIDLLWRAAVMLIVVMTMAYFGRMGTGVVLITAFVLEWIVPAWLEAKWEGATPGKRALGLRVISEEGAPVSFSQAMSRNLLRFVDFLPLFYFIGLTAMVCSRRFQRLGDMVAGTLVVHVESLSSRGVRPAAQPLTARAPLRPLTPDEARWVIALAARSPELGPARTAELLAIAAPLLGPVADLDALKAIALHLTGGDGAQRAPG